MKKMPGKLYQTAAELEIHIKAREAQANDLPPTCELRKTSLREVARCAFTQRRTRAGRPNLKREQHREQLAYDGAHLPRAAFNARQSAPSP